MNKLTASVIGTTILFTGSIIGNVILYDFWKQEKTAHTTLSVQLKQVEMKLRATTENSPEQLKKVAEEFVKTLFSFDKNSQTERKKRLLKLASKKLGKELFDKSYPANTEPIGAKNSQITSLVTIKDSVYNQTGPDTAKVLVTIEQSLQTDNMEDKTIQEIQVDLSYNGEEWKVVKFSAKPIL